MRLSRVKNQESRFKIKKRKNKNRQGCGCIARLTLFLFNRFLLDLTIFLTLDSRNNIKRNRLGKFLKNLLPKYFNKASSTADVFLFTGKFLPFYSNPINSSLLRF